MLKLFNPVKSVQGEISLPGDKSISHRALIFSAMANGISVIENLSDGSDVRSTINCLKQIGVSFNVEHNKIAVKGVGYRGFKVPAYPMDCGNSGTTARLLAGLLTAQNFNSKLIGDKSLSNRPMRRLITPLKNIGGILKTLENDTLPISITGTDKILSIEYELDVPSAQVKSAVLIAGLHSESETFVIETISTRDHTERLLGLEVMHKENKIISKSSLKNYPRPENYIIPGDISSASFLIVLTLLSKNSVLLIKNVSLNSTRIKFIDILIKMGGKIKINNPRVNNNEDYGDLLIKSSILKNLDIDKNIIPSIIDEIPVLAVAAAFAEGKFEIRNCSELRMKESDRIKTICHNLKIAGLDVEEFDDGFALDGEVTGKKLIFKSFGDHRIAMAFAVLSMLSANGGSVKGFESADISNPGFINQLNTITNFN